jgi:ABC-type nitrate/sulfonate/bicarbonate transport system permease component
MKVQPISRRMVFSAKWFAPLSGLSLLIFWEILAVNKLISDLFFPAPSVILTTLLKMILSGKLFTNLGATLLRLIWGMIVGVIPGVVLGLAMGWSKRIRVAVDPIISVLNPIPKLAIFPLIMIIFGIGNTAKIFVIAITTFFPMLLNSMSGVRQLNQVYFEVARNYGANRWNTFFRIILPGSLPMILTGLRIAFSLALVITIAVELLSADKGLGVLIWFSWETLRTTELYATLMVISVLGFLTNYILTKSSYWLIPWYFKSKKDVV